jgi:DNA replicative helicase MCM subunit Mcm2 (Cdc46/Mcm family)
MIDRTLLLSTLARLEQAVEKEDAERAVELLRHIVPEYRQSPDAMDDADKVRHIQLQAL